MRHSINIRFISEDEVEVVHQLAHRIWPPTFESILSKDRIAYMLAWMYPCEKLKSQLQNGHRFAIAEDERARPLGFIGLEANVPEIGKLRIHKLYVLPETQGTGLGRAFIDFALNYAQEQGLSSLHLNVNRFNPATRFYQHLGFEIVGEEDIDIGNGYLMEDFVMELKGITF